MDEKKRSQEIFEDLEKLEAGKSGIELRWRQFNEGPVRELAQRFLIAKLLDPEKAETLQQELTEKLKGRDAEKDSFLIKLKALQKELFPLTQEAIINSVREINDEVARVRSKHVSEILSKRFVGFSKTTMLTVRNNDEAIREAEALGKEGSSKLQGMHFSHIRLIESEEKKFIERIHQIDVGKFSEKEISEENYYRARPAPAGIGPGTVDYSGPLSGLR